ncbi:MAG: SCO family protein [Gammaproteobacteria bacterium]
MYPVLLVLVYSLFYVVSVQANGTRPGDVLQKAGLDQKLNGQIALDLAFRDENGRAVKLGEYFGNKPVILMFMYYECPNLCPLVLDGVIRSLKALSFNIGDQFNVLTVSIDPEEGPALAMAKKRESIRRYGRPGAEDGWHFLTGEEASIKQLTEAVGFRYAYDPETDQYAHASGIIILTPQGRISRYLYGIEYPPRDVRLGLVEASAGKIGSPVDQLLLLCYQYDPTTGKYNLVITNVLRLAGVATALGLGSYVLIMVRRERAGRAKTDKEGIRNV